jgi:WD40 repeat protein
MTNHSRFVVPVALLVVPLVFVRPNAASHYSAWSDPVNLGPVINSPYDDGGAAISKRGLSLYFHSDRPGGKGGNDIWVSHRATLDDAWGDPVNVDPVNSPFGESVPALSRDGHWMFFNSVRPGGAGATDLWASFRANTHDDLGWQTPVNLGAGVNTSSNEAGTSFLENEDGGTPLLFFGSDRPGGTGSFDIYVSAMGDDGSFGPAARVPELNSPQFDQRPAIRFDGLEMMLHSNRFGSLGGGATMDLWVSTRETVFDAWSTPVNLGTTVNTMANDLQAYLSPDRQMLFFASDRPGGFGGLDLYFTTRTKVDGR